MKTVKPAGSFKPFENLGALLKDRALPQARPPVSRANPINPPGQGNRKQAPPDGVKGLLPRAAEPGAIAETDHEADRVLFFEAMADVTPIGEPNRVSRDADAGWVEDAVEPKNPEAESLRQLKALVDHGQGFRVSSTSEYIEGCGYQSNPEIARRLHRGQFSIQAHLDLHGFSVVAARDAFERFLTDAIRTGKRAVSVVHGRGLSSPGKPILKTKVVEWVTCGPWRKWIIAYASARSCDGGAGATYLLLRRRPATRSTRRKKKWE